MDGRGGGGEGGGRVGGEGRGGEGRDGREGGREEGGERGREGRDGCYTYSDGTTIFIKQSRHVLRNNVSRCLPMSPQYLNNNQVTYYVITQVGVYAEQWYVLRPT